ncbi:hypothetical protein ABID59_000199 [Bradyrhizobium sp. S3.3.6]|uniref:hypothetical protein n=1 Tax=Bradyrhizobium sp. S3.3.6 TaxID=3156429 RepID=UPI0033984511
MDQVVRRIYRCRAARAGAPREVYGGAKTSVAIYYVDHRTKTFKLGHYYPNGADVFPDPESGEAALPDSRAVLGVAIASAKKSKPERIRAA